MADEMQIQLTASIDKSNSMTKMREQLKQLQNELGQLMIKPQLEGADLEKYKKIVNDILQLKKQDATTAKEVVNITSQLVQREEYLQLAAQKRTQLQSAYNSSIKELNGDLIAQQKLESQKNSNAEQSAKVIEQQLKQRINYEIQLRKISEDNSKEYALNYQSKINNMFGSQLSGKSAERSASVFGAAFAKQDNSQYQKLLSMSKQINQYEIQKIDAGKQQSKVLDILIQKYRTLYNEGKENLLNEELKNKLLEQETKNTEKLKLSQTKSSDNNGALGSATVLGKFLNTAIYTGSYVALNTMTSALKDAITFTNELNKAQTNIKMITGANDVQVQQMTKDYSKLASQLHDTTSSVMQASEEFLRAGHNQEETTKLIQASTVMSKIAGQDQKTSADQLIAITNGFKMSAEETMSVVDKLTMVDNNSATSTKELGDAIERTASSAQMAGKMYAPQYSNILMISWLLSEKLL